MTLPITRLIAAARSRGLSESNGVLLTFDSPQGVRINITVSYHEPISIVAPMDLIWIHPDQARTLRRVSRAESVDFTHTWQLADESNFWEPQVWDEPRPNDQSFQELDRNIGNPHLLTAEDLNAISVDGAQMIGPIKPRVLSGTQTYAADEAVPRSFVEKLTLAAQSLASSVAQQLTSLRNLHNNTRSRLVIVENKLQDISVGEGTPRYKHDQLEESLEWVINHSLNTLDVTIEARTGDGVLMIPAEQVFIDTNVVKLTFAEPRTGKALLIGVR